MFGVLAADSSRMSVAGSCRIIAPLLNDDGRFLQSVEDFSVEAYVAQLLRNSGFSARYRRCLALRHQNFDLTKQHHDLLRTEPLLRHTLVPFQAHPLTKLGPRNPGQVTCARLPLFIPRECDSYSPPTTCRTSKARDQATWRIRRCAHRRTVFRILEKSGTCCRHRPRPGSRSRETRRG